MKNHEFYNKHKVKYPAVVNPIFSRGNWWRLTLIICLAVAIEPFIIYKYQRLVAFSLDYYVRIVGYTLAVVLPFGTFLIWANWRELTKQNRGYGWSGKFEVKSKRRFFSFCYLLLEPGDRNEIRVNRILFDKTRVGDLVMISRDALGNLVDVSKVSDLPSRLAKAAAKRVMVKSKTDEPAVP